jgi:hypothetical protein
MGRPFSARRGEDDTLNAPQDGDADTQPAGEHGRRDGDETAPYGGDEGYDRGGRGPDDFFHESLPVCSDFESGTVASAERDRRSGEPLPREDDTNAA